MPGDGRVFSSTSEAIMALDHAEITLQSKVKIRFLEVVAAPPATTPCPRAGSRVSR